MGLVACCLPAVACMATVEILWLTFKFVASAALLFITFWAVSALNLMFSSDGCAGGGGGGGLRRDVRQTGGWVFGI